MFKNQLQELAQRSCFNLPSYTCIREGPDHAPRFKASVNFNGEIFDSPTYCTTLRQAEHAAAEVALNALSTSGPSRSLTARVLDETGVYKNLLQETAHRAGLNLPVYTTVRSGPGHLPVFTSTVELAGMSFVGESAKTKKQAEKNAAIAAWSALKTMPNMNSLSQSSKESDSREGREQMTVAKTISTGPKDESRVIRKRYQNQSRRRLVRSCRDNGSSNKDTVQQQGRLMDLFVDFTKEGFSTQKQNWFASLLPPPPPRTTSKILPSACPSSPDLSKTKPIALETMGSSHGQIQEMKPPLDEHQKRLEEWTFNQEKNGPSKSSSSAIDKTSPVYNKPITQATPGKLNIPTLDRTAENRTRVNVPRAPPQMTLPPIKVGPRCSQVGLGMPSYNGGYPYHTPQRIAPAVQIRSVIPVCAAPPPTMRPSSSLDPDSAVKEVILKRAPTSLPQQTGPEASLTGLQSRTTELSSTFSKLRLS